MRFWESVGFFFVAGFVREDVACLTAIALIAEGQTSPAAALLGCGLGFLFGDFFWIGLGKAFGLGLSRIRWLIRHDDLVKWRAWAADRGPIVLFWAGLLPGIRTPVQVAIGTLGVPWRRCIGYVVVASLLYSSAMGGLILLFDLFLSESVVADVWMRRLLLAGAMIMLSIIAVALRAPLTRWLRGADHKPQLPQ